MPFPELPPVTLDTFGEPELDDLDDKIAHVLRMRAGMMGEQVSLKEIDEELGVGQERIRQFQNEGLTLIRKLREVQRHNLIPPTRHRYGYGYISNRLQQIGT